MTPELRVIIVPVSGAPYESTISNELKDFQRLVGGHIETVGYGEYLLVVNDEGKLNGMHWNPHIMDAYDTFCGQVVITKTRGEWFVSLSDMDVKRIMEMLA